MALFAQINEQNIVTLIHSIADDALNGAAFPESETLGQTFQASLGIDGVWVQCSEDGSFRGGSPSPGWTYDSKADLFLPPIVAE